MSPVHLHIKQLIQSMGLPSLECTAPIPENTPGVIEASELPDVALFTGDNLGHLIKYAQSSPGIFDLCYIDPPYNTSSKFLYPDSRKSETLGVFGTHAAWMAFMLARLVAARALLKDTGVIAISIDDYEHAYLKLLMDRVFGEDAFIGNIVVCRSKNGKGSNRRNISPTHEYLVIYGKTERAVLYGLPDETEYDQQDEYGRFRVDGLFRKKGEGSLREDRPNLYYPLYYCAATGRVSVESAPGLKEVFPKDSKGIERRWLWARETAQERAHELYASKRGVVYVKNYEHRSGAAKRSKVRTIWTDTSFYTERATIELTKLFGTKVFDTPKPLEYIKTILQGLSSPDALVLDFFAGSGTTAHAAACLNALDGGTRKTVLMEDCYPVGVRHAAYAAGFKTTCEITASRLDKLQASFDEISIGIFGDVCLSSGNAKAAC